MRANITDMTASLFWKSTCTTCRDARKFLQDSEIAFEDYNYVKQPLTEALVLKIVAAAGSVEAVLNTRHEIAKQNGWKQTPPSSKVFAAAVLKETNLLRRPIFLDGKSIIVGFDREQYGALK
jgi:arsenate reductase (glutaredoxin)